MQEDEGSCGKLLPAVACAFSCAVALCGAPLVALADRPPKSGPPKRPRAGPLGRFRHESGAFRRHTTTPEGSGVELARGWTIGGNAQRWEAPAGAGQKQRRVSKAASNSCLLYRSDAADDM
eukprot:5992911-Alexandrium_andersonii.AAC.1